MPMRKLCSGLMMAVLVSPALADDGAALYAKYCAQCHDSGAARIPPRSALRELPREQILRSLEFTGKISLVVQNGRVLKSGYEEGYFRQQE